MYVQFFYVAVLALSILMLWFINIAETLALLMRAIIAKTNSKRKHSTRKYVSSHFAGNNARRPKKSTNEFKH